MKITRRESGTVGSCLQTPPRKNRRRLGSGMGLLDIRGCSFHSATSSSQSDSDTPTAGFCASKPWTKNNWVRPNHTRLAPLSLLSPLKNPALLSSLHPSGFLNNSDLTEKKSGRERHRERERERDICCSIYLCIHWLILAWALTGDRTHDPLSYPARAQLRFPYLPVGLLIVIVFLPLTIFNREGAKLKPRERSNRVHNYVNRTLPIDSPGKLGVAHTSEVRSDA